MPIKLFDSHQIQWIENDDHNQNDELENVTLPSGYMYIFWHDIMQLEFSF